MLIYLLAFVGGVLTILSPFILTVLPFVFARADQPFRRSGLPLLTGMALTFSLVAIAAAFGGHWVTEHRLYQLIRQKGTAEDRTFEIKFIDPGVQAFAFTFG
jgi:cytochrome c biogenesis protein CcdA